MIVDDLDPDEGYLPSEALCLVHNLTFNRCLPACPSCVAEAPLPWSPR